MIELLEPFCDPLVERRAPGDRGKLDDPAAVAVLALLVRAPPNGAGETMSFSHVAEAAKTMPPDDAE